MWSWFLRMARELSAHVAMLSKLGPSSGRYPHVSLAGLGSPGGAGWLPLGTPPSRRGIQQPGQRCGSNDLM